MTIYENEHPFVECANLADYMVSEGDYWQFPWHFIDTPLLEPGTSADDYDIKMSSTDAVGALTDLSKFLKGEIGYDDSYYV